VFLWSKKWRLLQENNLAEPVLALWLCRSASENYPELVRPLTGKEMEQEIRVFLESWEDTPRGIKEAFVRLTTNLAAKNGLRFFFKARPGISYSLRAAYALQKERALFVIMDVIDDDPQNRWLSVCFYPDMITDPDERGNLIPWGLLGEDGYCFDLDAWDGEYLSYLEARQDEAYMAAAEIGKQ